MRSSTLRWGLMGHKPLLQQRLLLRQCVGAGVAWCVRGGATPGVRMWTRIMGEHTTGIR